MRTRADLVLVVVGVVVGMGACSAGPSMSPTSPALVDGGTGSEGGVGPEGGVGTDGGSSGSTPDAGGSTAGADGGGTGGEGGLPEAGTTVKPGSGCAAGLGIDAGFYTCSNQYFV